MHEAQHANEFMKRLIRHIEDSLPSELDTGLLSHAGYVSHAKLYRGFYDLTGHSVKEYIRKRRLSNALALIRSSDFTFSDIAQKSGYSSHQTMCRAIKRTLSMTPSEYKTSDTYYFFPPFTGESLQSVTVSNESAANALRVLYYQQSALNIENTAVSTFLHAMPDYAGRIFGRDGQQTGSRFCYELYLTDVEQDYTVLESYGFKVTGEITCFNAVFAIAAVRNDTRKINGAWNYLYCGWLQNSMFEYTNEPYFEEYMIRNNKITKLKLYLPIRKRSEETKITLIRNPGIHFIAAKAEGYNAEKTAANTVVDYLAANYPYMIHLSHQLYLRKSVNSCTCGVLFHSELPSPENGNILSAATEGDHYLVLESSVMGDYDRYSDMLLSFALNNGLAAEKDGIFAIYDAKTSFDHLNIKMYLPVKTDTK